MSEFGVKDPLLCRENVAIFAVFGGQREERIRCLKSVVLEISFFFSLMLKYEVTVFILFQKHVIWLFCN